MVSPCGKPKIVDILCNKPIQSNPMTLHFLAVDGAYTGLTVKSPIICENLWSIIAVNKKCCFDARIFCLQMQYKQIGSNITRFIV
jgi:hypothetical protein